MLSKAVLKGASHLYAGQEAVAVGAVAALRDDDMITSTHRGHGHAHAHGDKYAQTPQAKQDHYNKMMAEVLGKSGGYCKGKGGSMHIADVEHGNLGATGIVGGNLAVAVGAALAQKMKGTDRVVVCFFGEGAANEGAFDTVPVEKIKSAQKELLSQLHAVHKNEMDELNKGDKKVEGDMKELILKTARSVASDFKPEELDKETQV